MVSRWSLSDSQSPHVSWTLLSILTDRNNAVILMIFNRPLISKSSSPSTNPLVVVPRAPITIGISITFTFNSFIIIIYSLEFLISALADGLLLELEWQQVSSSLHVI